MVNMYVTLFAGQGYLEWLVMLYICKLECKFYYSSLVINVVYFIP